MSNEWFYAACAKVQFNDEAPFIIEFRDTNFRSSVDQSPNVDFNDAVILALLSQFFLANEDFYTRGWGLYLPRVNHSNEHDTVFYGTIFDSELKPNYPINRTSLVCFTKEILRQNLSETVPIDSSFTQQEWVDLVQSTPFDELQELVNQYAVSGELVINAEKATLKIMRCSQAEIQRLDPFGGLDAPYVDIFDLVKERLTNTVNELEQKGLMPAKYYSDGDYIEFAAECSMTLLLTEMPPRPT
ncbi:hypothetical protein [Psychrobacter piscatorii]|uniref:hypothetical protein n=1 Tax=Psychrobacter piscatorii TaxID=554343 RepID=UPI003734F5D6